MMRDAFSMDGHIKEEANCSLLEESDVDPFVLVIRWNIFKPNTSEYVPDTYVDQVVNYGFVDGHEFLFYMQEGQHPKYLNAAAVLSIGPVDNPVARTATTTKREEEPPCGLSKSGRN